jgi:cation transport regulator ChaC
MSHSEPVWVFFYGSYMNVDVLAEAGLSRREFVVGRLSGFDIRIAPLANLVRSDQHGVYGLVTRATHDELSVLYRHASDVLGGTYLPHPVNVELADGSLRAALCYLGSVLGTGSPRADYVERIVAPARLFGFPAWYIARLVSFRPT